MQTHAEPHVRLAVAVVGAHQPVLDAETAAERERPRLLGQERVGARLDQEPVHTLGADRAGVLVHVMRQGLLLTGIGVVLGLAGAFGLSGLIASLLFGVTPTDVPTVAGVTATMIIVAAAACVLPAWRASRLDPNAVLRV